jgi:hypothetical protein
VADLLRLQIALTADFVVLLSLRPIGAGGGSVDLLGLDLLPVDAVIGVTARMALSVTGEREVGGVIRSRQEPAMDGH